VGKQRRPPLAPGLLAESAAEHGTQGATSRAPVR
jgi:hypothetical protein